MDGSYFTPQQTERSDPRHFRRHYLHMLYLDTLKDYRNPTSDWMRRATRQTLLNIWENYRATWSNQ